MSDRPALRPALTLERYKDAEKRHRWRAVAANGRIVADSGQGYRRRADMEHALTLLASNLWLAVLDGAPTPPGLTGEEAND